MAAICSSPFHRIRELHKHCYSGELEKAKEALEKMKKKKQENPPKYPTTYEADPLNCGTCCFSEWTPLIFAIVGGRIEVVKFLLKEGAHSAEEKTKKYLDEGWRGKTRFFFAKEIPERDSKTTKELERMFRERCWYEYDLDGAVKLFLAYQHGSLSCLPLDIIKYISKNFMMKRITF